MTRKQHGTGFRPDIEGLRGISIGSVVLYHAGGLLPGGFTGVDVFFVLSGFLITGILVSEHHARGRIDFAGFWSRRVRRILPQSTLVLFVTALLSVTLVPPLLVNAVGRDILSAGLFVLNWRAAGRAVDYSDPGSDLTPVLHYWSLAVEEQFYLAWPIILAVLLYVDSRRSSGHRFTLLGTVALLAASLLYAAIETPLNQPLAFFSTPARIWQLLSGAAIAVWFARGRACPGGVARWLGPLGMLITTAGFLLPNASDLSPIPVSLLPVAGTMAIVYAGNVPLAAANMASRLLSWPPLMYVGRISYAWYLWHWPALYFAHQLAPDNAAAMAAAFAGSFAVSSLTFHFFENPLRFSRLLVTHKYVTLGFGGATVAVAVIAGALLAEFGSRQQIQLSDGSHFRIEAITKDRSKAYKNDCHLSQTEITHPACKFGEADKPVEIVLFGDSHAAQFFDPLVIAATARGRSFLMRSKSGCAPVMAPIWNAKYKRIYEECERWKADVISTIDREKPKLVILSGATAYSLVDPATGGIRQGADAQSLYRAGQTLMIQRILQSAAHVAVIKDTPRLPEEPLNCLAVHPRDETACQWPLAKVSSGRAYVGDFGEFAQNVQLVDLNELICPEATCRAVIDDTPTFYDISHLTASFASRLAPKFEQLLAQSGL